LQKRQQELQQQINDQNSQFAAESQKKASLDETISITRQQILLLNTQISTLDSQLDIKNHDIAATQQYVDANYSLFKQYLCAMYEVGNVSYIGVLLSSANLTDFLSRMEMLKTISEHDNDIINNLRQDEAKLKDDQAALQAARTSLSSSQGTLAAKQDILNAQLAQQSQLVSQLKDNINSNQQQTAQVAQQAHETDAEINAEIAKEAAAHARKLAEQAAVQKQSGGQASSETNVNSLYIVNYAEGFEGIPYVFGCADPKIGFDCSGFVQYVFANAAGIYLTHSALEQSRDGISVEKNNLQAGDLVFFDTTGGNTVNHVGIYVGNDQFIEANSGLNSPDEVIVTKLFSSAYWSKHYISARRI